MKRAAWLAIAGAAMSWASTAKSQDILTPIVTSYGVFRSCEDAVGFRDGALKKIFDQKLASYDGDKEARIAAAVQEFQSHRVALEKQLLAADEARKLIIARAGAQVFASMIINKLAGLAVSRLPGDGVPKVEREALDTIIKGTGELSISTAAQAASGTADAAEILSGRARQYLELVEMFGRSASRMHPVTAGAFRVLDVGFVTVPAAFDWLEKDLDKKVAQGDLQQTQRAIERLVGKSGKAAISDLNRVKASIDKACRTKERGQLAQEMGQFGEKQLTLFDARRQRTTEIENKMKLLDRWVRGSEPREAIERLDKARRDALAALQGVNDNLKREMARAARAAEIARFLDVAAGAADKLGDLSKDMPAKDKAALSNAPSREAARVEAIQIERESRWRSGVLQEEIRYRSIRLDDMEVEQLTRLRQRVP